MKSTQYKCPNCGTPLDIEAIFEADEEYGDSIKLSFTCEKCCDTRYTSLSEWQYGAEFKRIIEAMKEYPKPEEAINNICEGGLKVKASKKHNVARRTDYRTGKGNVL